MWVFLRRSLGPPPGEATGQQYEAEGNNRANEIMNFSGFV